MSKVLLSALICALLVAISMALFPSPANAQSITIYVRADFVDDPAQHMWNKIQEGINDARDGTYDTVYVYAGTYNENVVINKSTLTLYGASSSQVTVNGQGLGYTISITANDVRVRQLKITGGNPAGVYWGNVYRGYVEKCDITNNNIGVLLESVYNQTIQCNKVHHNAGDGIQAKNSQLKDLTLNSSYSNGNAGISLLNSTKIAVFCNKSYSNAYGIYIDSTSGNNDIYLNDFYSNSIANGTSAGTSNNWRTPESGGRSYCYNGVLRQGYLGNYWGDYSGSDADRNGIGDTPYSLSSEQDSYPLMVAYSNYPSSCGGQLPSCGAEQSPPPPPTPPPTPTPTPSSSQVSTPAGSNVIVYPGNYIITYWAVISSGTTTVVTNAPNTCGGLPEKLQPEYVITFIEITTTATYGGPIRVGIPYDSTIVQNPKSLKVFQCSEGQWNDLTVEEIDSTNNIIYVRAPHLSLFLLGAPAGACFIATAAYGSPLNSHVDTLRSFRDQYLETNPLGSAFVSLYYKVSPPMADYIEKHPTLKPVVRVALIPAVAMSSIALSTTPLQKLLIMLALLASLSSVIALVVRRRVHRQRMH